MEAERVVSQTTPAGIRVIALDPGTTNLGFSIVELTHVTSSVSLEGPATRIVHPHFHVLAFERVNLGGEEEAYPLATHGFRLAHLEPRLSSIASSVVNAMPRWRRSMDAVIDKYRALIMTPYQCTMTGSLELPVIAMENQLDGAVADSDKGYPKSRMYTLTQMFASCIEACDTCASTDAPPHSPLFQKRRRRLVINAAKKYGMPSDGSMTYNERKRRSERTTLAMLRATQLNKSGTETKAARDAALAMEMSLSEVTKPKKKIDDICDAFLLAIGAALKTHKAYYKKIHTGLTPHCYTRVLKAERDAARAQLPPTPVKLPSAMEESTEDLEEPVGNKTPAKTLPSAPKKATLKRRRSAGSQREATAPKSARRRLNFTQLEVRAAPECIDLSSDSC